jgi:hypothetical protein
MTMIANAQDRVFTYAYQSGVLNQGQREIEVWNTFANGRINYYRDIDHNLEFEMGLGHNLQTSIYLNTSSSTAVTNTNGIKTVDNGTDFSVSNEWKWKLSDAVANRIGSGLYLEGLYSPTEASLEARVILDKQMGKALSVFNVSGEYVIGKNFSTDAMIFQVTNENTVNVEWNYAFSYKVLSHLNIGFEAWNQNQIIESKWANSAMLLGPCFSYYQNSFWINLTCLPQVANFKSGGLDLINHERLQTRLAISYAL